MIGGQPLSKCNVGNFQRGFDLARQPKSWYGKTLGQRPGSANRRGFLTTTRRVSPTPPVQSPGPSCPAVWTGHRRQRLPRQCWRLFRGRPQRSTTNDHPNSCKTKTGVGCMDLAKAAHCLVLDGSSEFVACFVSDGPALRRARHPSTALAFGWIGL